MSRKQTDDFFEVFFVSPSRLLFLEKKTSSLSSVSPSKNDGGLSFASDAPKASLSPFVRRRVAAAARVLPFEGGGGAGLVAGGAPRFADNTDNTLDPPAAPRRGALLPRKAVCRPAQALQR